MKEIICPPVSVSSRISCEILLGYFEDNIQTISVLCMRTANASESVLDMLKGNTNPFGSIKVKQKPIHDVRF
jgi:hypothetical protein